MRKEHITVVLGFLFVYIVSGQTNSYCPDQSKSESLSILICLGTEITSNDYTLEYPLDNCTAQQFGVADAKLNRIRLYLSKIIDSSN